MPIYMFKSETNNDLCAFAGDVSGSKLPDRFCPWQATGVVDDDKSPPHGLPRADIEIAIKEHGFQLWRMKAKSKNV